MSIADRAGPQADSISCTNKLIEEVITVENKSRTADMSEKQVTFVLKVQEK